MKTYVPQKLYDEATSRPDWPELERKMLCYYGEDWELVPYERRYAPEGKEDT